MGAMKETGWKEEGNGWLSAEQWQSHITPAYARFSEAMRARWDLVEYLKVAWRQFREQHRRTPKNS